MTLEGGFVRPFLLPEAAGGLINARKRGKAKGTQLRPTRGKELSPSLPLRSLLPPLMGWPRPLKTGMREVS